MSPRRPTATTNTAVAPKGCRQTDSHDGRVHGDEHAQSGVQQGNPLQYITRLCKLAARAPCNRRSPPTSSTPTDPDLWGSTDAQPDAPPSSRHPTCQAPNVVTVRQRCRAALLVVVAVAAFVIGACSKRASPPAPTPVQQWMAMPRLYVAHRGGDADWPEGTAFAYARSAARNPDLALGVPARRTVDGVWVVSEDPTTTRVFGTDYVIAATPWSTLARLRGRSGAQPMARLVNDVLDVYSRNRILFIDNKANTDIKAFFDLLDSYAGRTRYVVKSYMMTTATPAEAHKRGYLTWGYYYPRDMAEFASTEARFDLLGLEQFAPGSDYATVLATGKPVIAFIIASADAGRTALDRGARGLMVSAVDQVVPAEPVK